MSGYRGFSSKKAYEDHYSNIDDYSDELKSMEDYSNEAQMERESLKMEDEIKQLRYACLELACRQTKLNDDGKIVDLNSDETVSMADAFYKFVNKQELN